MNLQLHFFQEEMPEGPEVKVTCDALNEVLSGSLLLDISWDQDSKFVKHPIKGFETLNFPYVIDSIWCKGKQIFFTLLPYSEEIELVIQPASYASDIQSPMEENPDNRYLNSHLGMEGHWVWEPEKHSNLWMTLNVEGEERILYFNDSRHFGNMAILNPKELDKKLDSLGPDLLSQEVSLELWVDIARNCYQRKKINSGMEIVDFLMDPRYFTGIGNYLKAEILYQSKIAPNRVMESLTDQDLEELWRNSVSIMKNSYASGGLTRHKGTFWHPDKNKGTYKDHLQVYEKDFDPLGNKVIKQEFSDKRTTHWVPEVQK